MEKWDDIFVQTKLGDLIEKAEAKVLNRETKGFEVYPEPDDTYKAFDLCDFPPKVVILGQDPYHTPGVANGLAFSANDGFHLPPSLKNIHKELESDLGMHKIYHGDLRRWARQGVLLLNTALTVEEGKPGSHFKIWQPFTKELLSYIGKHSSDSVIVLWGKKAQEYEKYFPDNPVLKAAHPSPFSAHKGFFGCKHFSKINEILENQGKTPIDWRL